MDMHRPSRQFPVQRFCVGFVKNITHSCFQIFFCSFKGQVQVFRVTQRRVGAEFKSWGARHHFENGTPMKIVFFLRYRRKHVRLQQTQWADWGKSYTAICNCYFCRWQAHNPQFSSGIWTDTVWKFKLARYVPKTTAM